MSKKIIVNLSTGGKEDKSTVAFTVANGALGKGMEVAVFLTSDAVDLCRDGSCEHTFVAPFKPLNELISTFMANGGLLWACTPCFNHRGLNENETVKGTIVTGAGPMLEWIEEGATVVSY